MLPTTSPVENRDAKKSPGGDAREAAAESSSSDVATKRRIWALMGILSVCFIGVAFWVAQLSGSESDPSPGGKAAAPKPVTVTTVQKGDLPLVVEYRGELDADIAELAAQGNGRLVEVRVNLGDSFKEGDVLAKVDATETRRLLSEAYAQSESALAAKERNAAQLETAKVEAARGQRMLAEQVTSEQEVIALKSQVSILKADTAAVEAQRQAALARVALYREQLAQAELKAPFDGAVAQRYLDPGATVAPGTAVLRLVKSGPLEVNFRASELHVNRLKNGTKLSVSTLSTGERRLEGTLTRVSAEVNRTDRSVAAEGTLSAEHPELRAGMYANVSVSLGTLEQAILVPEEALTSKLTAGGTTERGLYRIQGDKAHYQPVTVLGEHHGLVAIKGVDLGQQVAISGQDLLSDGAPVQIKDKPAP